MTHADTKHLPMGFRTLLFLAFVCWPQFFPRTQMQTARPSIPTNTPSIRPGSQTPTAAVYPTNQAIMMTMAPMPFPSPQAAQYYIPQVSRPLRLVITVTLQAFHSSRMFSYYSVLDGNLPLLLALIIFNDSKRTTSS